MLTRLAIQLRDDLDLLTTREQEADGHARHARHLDVIDDQHQLLDQLKREEGVLEAVDGQTAAALVRAVLQLCDNTMRIMRVEGKRGLRKKEKKPRPVCCILPSPLLSNTLLSL